MDDTKKIINLLEEILDVLKETSKTTDSIERNTSNVTDTSDLESEVRKIREKIAPEPTDWPI